MNYKTIKISIFILLASLFVVLPVFAQLDPKIFEQPTMDMASNAGYDTSYPDPLPVIIGRIIKALLSFVAIILLGLIVYGGFLWMTAGGDKEQVKKAIDYIKNATIGVLITFVAYSLTVTIVYLALEGTYGWRWWPY